jgi:hypothetical protein
MARSGSSPKGSRTTREQEGSGARQQARKPGRPADSPEEKKAKQEAREREKEAAKQAKIDAKKAAADVAGRAMSEEERPIFLNYLPKVEKARKAIADATKDIRHLYKEAKSFGLDKSDFDVAFDLSTPEKEAKTKAKILRHKMIASYLGIELELVGGVDRRPASAQAYEEGKTAAMRGDRVAPDYHPSTEQYRKYMEGYHVGQELYVKNGIKQTNDAQETAKKPAAPESKQDAPKPQSEDSSTSGIRMTRADYERELRKAEQEKQASQQSVAPNKQAPPTAAADDDDEPSMFRKRPQPAA